MAVESTMKPNHVFGELRLPPDVERMLGAEIQETPRWADMQNRGGLMALARGDLTGALERFDAALGINPRYAWAAVNRALVLGLAKQPTEAAAALADAAEPEPGVMGYVAAVLALLAGDGDGETALAGLPSELAARADFRRLRAALLWIRDRDEGEAAWDQVRHHFASLPEDWSRPWNGEDLHVSTFVPGLGRLYLDGSSLQGRLGRWEAAETLASLSRLHWADEAVYLNQRGFLATVAGRDEKARGLHEEAARVAPERPDAHIALAYLWSAAGDMQRAYRSLSSALARAPRYADLLYQMGLLQLARDEADEALASFRAALEVNPEYTMARLQEAEVLFTRERWAEACSSYQRVLATGLESWEIRLHYGQALQEMGDLDGALRACRDAVDLAPAEPGVLYHLGRIHRLRGEGAEAEAAWREFLELDGDPDQRAEVERTLDAEYGDRSQRRGR